MDIATGGVVSIDGANTVNNDRILLVGQTAPAENGIYKANSSGAWSRASDANSTAEIRAAFVAVWQGGTYGGSLWFTDFKQGNTIGTTAMNWYQIATGDNIIGLIDSLLGSSSWQGGGYTDEQVRDIIGTALTNGTGITITVNDAGDTITIALDGTATTAAAGDADTTIATTAFVDATLYATDNVQSGTTYTLALDDYRKEISLTHATGCALTIPLNSSVAFPVGTRIAVWNDSAGTHTINGASGVTLNGVGSAPTGTMTVNASGVRGGVLLRKTATDEWTVTGAIGAVA